MVAWTSWRAAGHPAAACAAGRPALEGGVLPGGRRSTGRV